MAGPGGVEAGRASVKVLPDLSGFSRSLERYLQRVERTLVVKLPTQLDTRTLDDDLARIRAAAARVTIPLKTKLQLEDNIAEIRARVERVVIPLRAKLQLEDNLAEIRAQAARVVIPLRTRLRLEQNFDEIRARALRVVVQVRARLRLDDNLDEIRARVERSVITLRAKLQLEGGLSEIQARVARTVVSIRARLELIDDFTQIRARLAREVLTVRVRIDLDDILTRLRAEIEGASRRAPAARVRTEIDRNNSLTIFSSVLSVVQTKIKAIAAGLLGVAANLAGVASVAPMITPFIASAAAATAKYGTAAVQAAPALLAFAAAGGIIALILKGIGPALLKSLTPINTALTSLATKASAAATKGVRPLAAAFAKAALPKVEPAITAIGKAAGGVVKQFLTWGKSAAGLTAIRKITTQTSVAFVKIAPAVGRFGIALGEMLGRIAKVSLTAGSSGLTGLLDKLSAAMKRVDAKSVRDGLDTLGEGIRNTVGFFKSLYRSLAAGVAFYQRFETEIKLVQDALAVFAIAFGGPVIAAIAAAGLIIRHWDLIKAAFTGVQGATSGFVANMVASFNTIKPAIAGFVSAILPPLKLIATQAMAVLGPALASIGTIIRTQVAPAFAAFVTAVTPVVTFLIQKFGVNFIAILKTLAAVVQNVFTIIAGVFNVFAGLLSGDWSRLWKGITQIVSGVWGIIKAVVTNGWTILKNLFATSGAILAAVTARIWGGIKDAIGAAWSGIKSVAAAGWAKVKSGVSSAWASVKSNTSSAWATVKSSVSSALAGMVSTVKTKFGEAVATAKDLPGKVKAGLGNLAGLLVSAGGDLVRGFVNGIKALAGQAAAVAGQMAQNAVNAVKSKLHIASPSKVMIALGKFAAQGFALGILSNAADVTAAGTALVEKVRAAVAAYTASKTSIAGKIEADRVAVAKAAKRYREVVADHAKSASASVRNAALSLKNAQSKYAADLKDGSAAKALDADRDRIAAAKTRYVQAVKDQGKAAARAIDAARESLKTAAAKLAKDTGLSKALDLSSGQLGALKGQQLTGLIHYIQVHTRELERLAAVREAVAQRLEDAKSALTSAIQLRDDYAKAIADSARAFGSIITASVEGQALSAGDVVAQLQAKLAAIQAFRASLDALRAQGLSNAALQQLVDAGVEAGSATAAALAQGGDAAIQSVNGLTQSISDQADSLGTSAAAQFYQAGVDAAQGLVNGLLAQQEALDAAAKKLADALVKQVKKSLGIKSPSTVMASLGSYIGEGLAKGIDSSRSLVEAATDRLSRAATPVAADLSMAGSGGGLTGGGGVTVHVTNPVPETASESTTRVMRRLALLGPA